MHVERAHVSVSAPVKTLHLFVPGIDPDYAAAAKGAGDLAGDDTLSALGDIAKVLGGGGLGGGFGGLEGAMGRADGVSLDDRAPARHTPFGGLDAEVPTEVPAPAPLQHAWTLGLDEGSGGKRVGTLAVPLASMAGVELEVSAGEVRVTTAAGRRAAVALPFAADADRTKAKYSKSSKTLKVTVTEA